MEAAKSKVIDALDMGKRKRKKLRMAVRFPASTTGCISKTQTSGGGGESHAAGLFISSA